MVELEEALGSDVWEAGSPHWRSLALRRTASEAELEDEREVRRWAGAGRGTGWPGPFGFSLGGRGHY